MKQISKNFITTSALLLMLLALYVVGTVNKEKQANYLIWENKNQPIQTQKENSGK